MSKRNVLASVIAAAGMLILILDSKNVLLGASEGLNLCIATLIPSLFPFIMLSIFLTSSLAGQALPVLRPLTALCRVPKGTESLLAVSFLGGYPIGAQNTAQLYRHGMLSKEQAARMIAFCNNAGPAFIFGYLGSAFSAPYTPWLIWLIQIIGAICVGMLLPGAKQGFPIQTQSQQMSLTKALEQALRIMAQICGWVIVMRIVITVLEHWFLRCLPDTLKIVLYGILELSNGCIFLHEIGNESLRFVITSGLLSLGGICVSLQTVSVAGGIPMRLYCLGKMLHCCISVSISCLLVPLLYPYALSNRLLIVSCFTVIGAFSLLLIHFFEKKSGNSAAVGV